MQLPRTPKWITFDLYGTLIDTRVGYVALWRDLLQEKSTGSKLNVMDVVNAWGEEEFRLIQGPYKKYREILKESVETTLRHFGLPVASGDGERLAKAWGTYQPYPDVNPVLSQLKKKFRLAPITNADNDIVAQSVASIGVEFDEVFTAERCGAYKPSRIPFEYALEHIGVPPREILHVAFGWRYDLPTATAMGFMTVWVNRRNLQLPPGAVQSDLVMPDLAQLPALLGLTG